MLRRSLLLAAVTVVPLVLLGAGVVWMDRENIRDAIEGRLLDAARTLAEEVNGEFSRGETALLVLSASSALHRGDLSAFEGEMRAVARGLGVHIGLATPDGFQALNTIWQPGERRRGVRAPDTAQDAVATGRAQVPTCSSARPTGCRW